VSGLGVYVHVPFCARRCDYCDFFIVVGERPGDFFDWLLKDLALAAAAVRTAAPEAGSPSLDTLYFGGGTPSLVEPQAIARVIEAVKTAFPATDGSREVEVTLEANPESVTRQRAREWIDAGVTRLSLGVQSLHDAVLPGRGRLYDAASALGAARTARDAGCRNLGLDLIAGLPGETPATFEAGMTRLIELRPEHVSIYLLETDDAAKETPLTRAVREGRETLPDDEDSVAMYLAARQDLTSAGYRHYEISNFALPGRESRHNLRYWRSEPWLGLGPSAHSHIGQRRFGRPADMAAWMGQVRDGLFDPASDDYTLPSPAARAREALILELRLIDGVDTGAFARRWGSDPAAERAAALDEMEREGWISRRGGRLALTTRGLLLSNEVFSRLT